LKVLLPTGGPGGQARPPGGPTGYPPTRLLGEAAPPRQRTSGSALPGDTARAD
jgi:hypothetical protein